MSMRHSEDQFDIVTISVINCKYYSFLGPDILLEDLERFPL